MNVNWEELIERSNLVTEKFHRRISITQEKKLLNLDSIVYLFLYEKCAIRKCNLYWNHFNFLLFIRSPICRWSVLYVLQNGSKNAEIFTLHQCAYFFVVESDRMCLLCFYKLLSLFQILTQLETPSRTFLVTRSGEELFESCIWRQTQPSWPVWLYTSTTNYLAKALKVYFSIARS